MVRALGVGVLVIVLLATPARAAVPLTANLVPSSPLSLSGVLAPIPSRGPSPALVGLDLPAGSDPGNATFFQAARAELTVLRWTESVVDSPETAALFPSGQTAVAVTQALLRLPRLDDRPQVLLEENPAAEPSQLLRASGARCLVENGDGAPPYVFADDPDQVSPPMRYPAGPRQLIAECDARRVASDMPGVLRFYGMDLWLDSAERHELIRTGTYEEPLAPGAPTARTVTQILVVRMLRDPASVAWEQPTRARLHAESFLASGDLAASASEGRLAWGPLVQTGRLEPFRATGEYAFAWSPHRHVDIQGSSVDGPAVAPAPSGSGPGRLALVAAATLAGLGILALLARVLWPLYTTLAPERLLEHPRRSRILDFVRANPGVETNAVGRALGISWTKTAYHVSRLRQGRHVVVRRLGGRTAIFAAGDPCAPRAGQVALLRRTTERRVFDALRARPGLSQAELAAEVGVSRPRITQVLRLLSEAGLVAAEPSAGRFAYRALIPAAGA